VGKGVKGEKLLPTKRGYKFIVKFIVINTEKE